MTRYGVDVGGTFTDIVALSGDGAVRVGKVRSTPGAVAPGVWSMLEGSADGAAALVHGTTVATNALLERRGGRVVLVTTAGFEDLLWLRRQDRAHLYDLTAHHPAPVVARGDVVGVAERIGAGEVVRRLTPDEVRRVVGEVVAREPEAVAVSLLFSFRDPTHEQALVHALREALPHVPIAAASDVLPVFREYERTSTTAAEAYLRPRVSGYLARMAEDAAPFALGDLRIMASNGGTLSVKQAVERAAALALSGPAGGVEGARLVGSRLGVDDLLTIDMGGTSADASLVLGGQPLSQTAAVVGGVPLALPHVLIETVGAGGGSIAWVDPGGALRVGPQSAGAEPGPACYGQGGEAATVTDATLVLGWLDPDRPLADALSLDRALARAAVARVADVAGLTTERCAEGIVEVAVAAMVRALRRVSVERGVDPRGTVLVPFGGAGPLFGCRMAEALGVTRLVVPPHAGVLSALGLATAPARIECTASLHRGAGELDAAVVAEAFAPLDAAAREELAGASLARFADCRYPGQGYELTVPVGVDGPAVARAFHALHHDRFGHADADRPVEVVNLRVVASRHTAAFEFSATAGTDTPRGGERMHFEALAPDTVLDGPCMLDGTDCTVRLEQGWRARTHSSGALVMERRDA
ncbi:MAG: hydantoinase/oxoprolinase family protein [Gemmatimonadales bacterium]